MYKQEDISISNFNPALDTYIVTDAEDLDISNLVPSLSHTFSENTMLVFSPQQEDTMDVSAKFDPGADFQPVSPCGPPERTVFAGELDFQVEINASDTHKRKYLYSSLLNRIYVDMKKDFSVHFSWQHARAPVPMFVRAVVVFSDEAQAEKRVERCTQHTHDANNAGIDQAIVKNVLHSSREKNTRGVYYCGQPAHPDSWYSVLVEFPTPSAGPQSHAYQFVCKNSCSSGINRRAIDIIFSLEDINGHVYARQTVGARVCSCPGRDIRRDEGERKKDGAPKGKRRIETVTRPHPEVTKCKRLKSEVESDDAVIVLPPIEVVGSRIIAAGLETMLRMTELAASLMKEDQLAAEKYSKVIANLKTCIEDLKKSHPQ